MIIHCDKEVMDNMTVMEFLQKDDMCNVPENTAKLMAPYAKDWTGPDAKADNRELDPADLTREDQIYLQTAYELHHYWKSRMRALSLTKTFEADYDETSKKLLHVVEVSESLRDSVSLMNVLGLILDVGNYMNDSNKQATGFKLSSLARLGMVKDEKNESTFADLVERIVRNQYPEWERFVEDIAGVVTHQKLNVEQLQQDARRYIDNIKNVQMSLDTGNLSDPKKFHPQDRVATVVLRSMKDARRKAEQMQLYLENAVRTYDDIMVFYGEDPTDDNSRRDFFSKLAIFVTEWKKSREKNIALDEVRKRNELSMQRKNAKNLNISASSLSDGSAPSSPAGNGAMDSLLEKLRQAKPAVASRDRRKARLQNRGATRVASGQQVPDAEENPSMEERLKSPTSASTDGPFSPGLMSPVSNDDNDVAMRAALLLQGLRGQGDGIEDQAEAERRESMRRAKRRENADEERKARRRRREKPNAEEAAIAEAGAGEEAPPPVTLTNPEGSEQKPIELDD